MTHNSVSTASNSALAAGAGVEHAFQSAVIAHRAGRLDEADHACGAVLALDADHADAWNLRGTIHYQSGRRRAAASAFRRALECRPDFAQAHNNLGNVLADAKQLRAAEACYRQALRLKPDYAMAHNNLGAVLADARRFAEAEAAYRRAIELRPDDAQAYSNLGVLLKDSMRRVEAEAAFRRALACRPDDAAIFNNLGNLLKDLDRLPEAEAAYRRAVALRPGFRNPLGQIPHVKRLMASWSGLEADDAALIEILRRGQPVDISPFQLLCVPDLSPRDIREAGRLYAQHQFGAVLDQPPMVDPGTHPRHQRLRIGYLSPDLHTHPVGLLMAGVLEQHDRTRFDVRLYSTGVATEDETRRRIQLACEQFSDVRACSDLEVARQIVADEIDLLIDLGGYTSDGRSGIIARRPAPVIVNWLGYPSTLGHPRLADFFISDFIRTPPGCDQDFSEKLARMPHSSQPNDRTQLIGPTPTRAQAGLPERGVVFCSFNEAYKFTPEVFALWCRLLREVPGSVLWLTRLHPVAMDNLRHEAAAHGVAPERLIFAERQPLPAHLGRLRLADVALDTLPYNSGATASNVLWAGVPLVSRIGATYVGRIAASLLNAMGVPELVTDSNEGYFNLARELAVDEAKRAALRVRLASLRDTAPLFDTPRFTRDLETLLLGMWEQHGRGLS